MCHPAQYFLSYFPISYCGLLSSTYTNSQMPALIDREYTVPGPKSSGYELMIYANSYVLPVGSPQSTSFFPASRGLIYSVASVTNSNVNHQCEPQHNHSWVLVIAMDYSLIIKGFPFVTHVMSVTYLDLFSRKFCNWSFTDLNTPALDIHQLPLHIHYSGVLSQLNCPFFS